MKNSMNKGMQIKLSMAAMLIGGLALSTPAMACDAAGPNTHVGQVLSVDGNHFTIRDAQTGGPISFTADEKMQGSMPAPGDAVTIKYSGHEKELIAESVE
ncbi:MAG: hypothetical protein Q9M12_07515 [Mariprofundus sp.]|nr:hypothetical protein [Mariprofundus sp.]